VFPEPGLLPIASLPRPGEPLRLLAIHAHPDDESSKGAATMARYVSEGVQVLVLSCTGGERGDILNPALAADSDALADLPALRRREMARAVEILGVEHKWLGFIDSGLPEGDPLPPLPEGSFAAIPLAEASAPVVELVREFRPHVITTYDENGGYPHPDHIRTHEVSMTAFEAAGDSTQFPGEAAPWQPLKLYYHLTFHKARLVALNAAALEHTGESPYADWLSDWEDKPEDAARVTTRVPCGPWFEARDAALLAHASQVDPTGRWFSLPIAMQQQVWGTEDYQLARTFVPNVIGADGVEEDLLAGIDLAMAAADDVAAADRPASDREMRTV
jgi:mycothiol S-conjugate amidase